MKVGDLVEDCELGLRGLVLYRDESYPTLWHVYYEDGHSATAFENALEVVSESR